MMFPLRRLEDLGDLSGKRVLVRVDWNVPFVNGTVSDEYRMKASLPTIEFLRNAGARVVLISHFEGEGKSLKPVAEHAQKFFPVFFIPETDLGDIHENLNKIQNSAVALLENIRLHEAEEENDSSFARTLASLGDCFVNEAFSVSHRRHASIIHLPSLLPSVAGRRFLQEVKELSMAFTPAHPFLFILGGAKFETKAPLIEKFLSLADTIFIGGAIANDFLKARGFQTGISLLSDSLPEREIFTKEKILLPVDVAVRTEEGKRAIRYPSTVGVREIISDIGPETEKLLEREIQKAKMILWNGPLGLFEYEFDWGTKKLAQLIAESDARSIVGGGDTLAAVESLGVMGKFSFVSTGGGAMLDFLGSGTLPGIEALQNGLTT